MALANWLNDQHVPLDLSWVEQHANPQFNTPEEVGALSGSKTKEKTTATYYSKQTVWLFGGVDLGVKPTFVANDPGAGALGGAVGGALEKAPGSPTLTVPFQGRNLRGLVLPITAEGAALWKSGEMRGPDGTVYRYDASLRVNSLHRPDGTEAKLAYDSGGKLTGAEVTSPDGRLMGKMTPAGSEMNVSSPAGDKFDYRWDGAGWLDEVRINNRPFVRCRHDRAANRSTLDYGAYREELTFDPQGRLISRDVAPVTRAGGTRGAARAAYDADGQLASLEIPGQGQLRVTRSGGDVTSLVGPWSQVRYDYDGSHHLTGVAFGDASARFAYQGEELASAEWSKGGEVLRARFSGGRLVEAEGLSGSALSYDYDPQGRLARASESGGGSAQYTYDDHNRIRGLTLPGGGSLEYRYTSPRARRGEAADPGELQMIIRHPENARRRGELPAEQRPPGLVRLARRPSFAPEEVACLPRPRFQVEAEAAA